MKEFRYVGLRRRDFLGAASAILGGGALVRLAQAAQQPAVKHRRAIGGDAVEPDWDSGVTITVGPEKADLVGTSEKVIQAAVDYVTGWGGGTVRVLPGVYRLRNAVFLRSRVRIVGSGPESVLVKEPAVTTRLAEDSDFYEQEITLADASGFQVGDGVCLRAHSQRYKGQYDVFTRSLVARSGNRFKLDRPLPGYPGYVDLWVRGEATATTLFALIHGEDLADAAVESITLDGNKANNEFLNGNHVACVFLRGSNRVKIRDVTARNFNGDGISWNSHDVSVEECHSHDNEAFGLHPGAGAQRPVARANKLERNDIGFFFCWGAQHGLVENNTISGNRRFGVSIGHKDTDNLIRHNEIRGSGEVGVLFRKEEGRAFAPSRNRLEDNRILDNGGESGIGVDVQGETEAVSVCRNEILETRSPLKRIGVRIGPDTKDMTLLENRIEGFSLGVLDQRQRSG